MKTNFILVSIFFLSILAKAQDADKQYDLLQNKTQTGVLFDRVFGLSNATNLADEVITTSKFNQIYSDLQRADYYERLPKYNYIKEQAKLGFATNIVPLSVLVADFESIKKDVNPEILKKALTDSSERVYDTLPNGKIILRNLNIFDEYHLTVAAPLLEKHKGKSVNFILKDNLLFNINGNRITAILVDFSDGNGYRKIEINQNIHIDYDNIGKKNINFKISLSNGDVMQISSSIIIQESEYPANTNRFAQPNAIVPNVVTPIAATIAYQGQGETAAYLGQGQYKYYPDTTDQILDKPIILLDGFDPGDSRSCDAIYSLVNYGTTGQNLATDLRAQGFDVFILNFPTYTRTGTTTVVDGGVDFIQRNAYILVELIKQINLAKVGTQKNVVIGPSMGGLISRYGLRYMEQNTLNHDTRLYISFDAPHYGANVPIGMQHLLNYMAYGPMASTSVQPIVDGMLKSPAARQMLIDHMEGHLQSGSAFDWQTATASLLPIGCPNFRNAFQTQLNTMGFPTTTRNVSIANGAGNGTMTGTPGMSVMNHTFISPTNSNQRAVIKLHFTPTTNTNLEVSNFVGQQWVIFWITGYSSAANSKSPTYTAGLDSAPGGRFDMGALTAGTTDPTLLEFANNLLINYFNFIPTWSSMSVTGTQNLYANFPNTGSITPFAAWSIPTVNENHITLNTQNTAFAINEIVGALATNNFAFDNLFVQNPVGNLLEINTNEAISDATITMVDMMGRTVWTIKNQTIENNYQTPIDLSKGIYLLTIKNNEGSVSKKVVKE